MKSAAYLSNTFFFPNFRVIRDNNILPVSLIAYDNLYVDINLDNLPWWNARAMILMKKNGKKLVEHIRKNKDTDPQPLGLTEVNFAVLLGGDPKVLQYLSGHLFNIRHHSNEKIREFFKFSFEKVMEKKGTSIFHPLLLPLLTDYFTKKLNYNWNYFDDRHLSIILIQELFVCSVLAKRFKLTPILTLNDIELRIALRSMPKIPIDMSEAIQKFTNLNVKIDFGPLLLQKYTKAKTIQGMVSFSNRHRKLKDVEFILELTAPNLSEIPIKEIAKLKCKDKFKSISRLAEEIRGNTNHFSSLDFAKNFIDYLWKAGKTLNPSIKKIGIGLLGGIPLPINPISILSSINDIQLYAKFEKKYPWFIVLSKLSGF